MKKEIKKNSVVERDGMFIDSNDNAWSGEKYTKEEAERESATLINCFKCLDCCDCVNCNGCINCEACQSCFVCHDCVRCKYCKKCRECDACELCCECEYCSLSKNGYRLFNSFKNGVRVEPSLWDMII